MLYFSPTKQVPPEIPKVEQDSKFYKDWSQVEKLCEIQICCYFSGPQLLEWGRGARSYSLLC